MKAYVWALAAAMAANFAQAQGGLTPPGAPAPSMKTLAQIEPRFPIMNLPYIIWLPGSYYVTDNLILLSNNISGITVLADNVKIDLNGFLLTGPGTGSGIGIEQSSQQCNLSIAHGNLSGWHGHAIYAPGRNGRFEVLTVTRNGAGMNVGPGSLVADCIASSNSSSSITAGFWGDDSCTFVRCIANYNRSTDGPGYGFYGESGCTFSDCAAAENTGVAAYGFALGRGCSLSRCAAGTNGTGFSVGNDCRVADSIARDNLHDGFLAGSRCMVSGCLLVGNGAGDGLRVASASIVRDCVSSGNYEAGIDVTGDNVLVTGCNSSSNRAAGIYVKGHRNRIEGNQSAQNDWGVYFDNSSATDHNLALRNSAFSNGSGNYSAGTGNFIAPVDSSGAFTNASANYSF